MVKNLPAMQETWVRSWSWEDPLEKEMATHSSILTWRVPWTEEPVGYYSPLGRKESDTTEWLILSEQKEQQQQKRLIFVHLSSPKLSQSICAMRSTKMHQESNWVKLALFISELRVGGKRSSSNMMATPPKLAGGTHSVLPLRPRLPKITT